MALFFKPPLALLSPHLNSVHVSPVVLSFPFNPNKTSINSRVYALKTESDGSDLFRKPIASLDKNEEEERNNGKNSEDVEDDEEEWVDWEDQILEDTVPLVGFVRMILHSGKYVSGDRLSEEHERTITERLLPYHPEYQKKIGPGIDYIKVGHHPEYETSRCLFIARKDGKLVDFSYWKCIKGLIRKNYPLHADSFIIRHFRRRKHS